MKKLLLGIVILISISGVGLLLAANQGFFGYSISSGGAIAKLNSSSTAISTSVTKIEEWGICKRLLSTDTRSLFIPTKTAKERTGFIANRPSYITLSACGCTSNSECSTGQNCVGYVAPTPSSCNGTYTTLGWQFNESLLQADIDSQAGPQGCVEGVTYSIPTYPFSPMPSYAPTYVGQTGNLVQVDWNGTELDFCIPQSAGGYAHGVGGTDDVRWEAVTTASNSCSSLSQTSCQSTAGCTYNAGSAGTPGTCITAGCRTNSDCSAGYTCNGYTPAQRICDGMYEYTGPGHCQGQSTVCAGITDENSCNTYEERDTQGNRWVRVCGRYPGQTSTQYCAQDFRTQSECNTQQECTWTIDRSEVLGTCTPLASCTLPRGGTIAHGASVTAYSSSSVACGSTCSSQTRTCNNGTLGGTYQYGSCTIAQCQPTCATYVGCKIGTMIDYTCQQDQFGSSAAWTCTYGGDDVACSLDSGGPCQ